MDVARAPMGYRDVPSGRASVAGEFARVARLHRARMRGKPFWFLLWRLTKGTRPRGRNKTVGQTRCGAETPKPRQLGYSPSVLFAAMTRLRPEWGKLREPSHNPK